MCAHLPFYMAITLKKNMIPWRPRTIPPSSPTSHRDRRPTLLKWPMATSRLRIKAPAPRCTLYTLHTECHTYLYVTFGYFMYFVYPISELHDTCIPGSVMLYDKHNLVCLCLNCICDKMCVLHSFVM